VKLKKKKKIQKDTHFIENEESMNKQATSEGHDDLFDIRGIIMIE
jgi:hypothetical protein